MHIDGKRRGNTRENTLHIPAHVRLWVEEIASLCEPDRVYWCDGTQTEWDRIATEQVARGSMVALNPEHYPNSYLARSAPNDVARTEGRTFICAASKEEVGPTNNWIAPQEGRARMQAIFKGCMRGRTLYVVPFCMGPIEAENRVIGVQVTDSAYAVLSMRIMTRIGRDVLETLGDKEFFARCIHSVGAPRSKGEPDTAWPCNDEKWILHFPESREIWSYGSGYGGNALLGKKCLALRIASVMARDQGWLAEHMLILKVTSPENKIHYIAGAFPSACGKTNLAMLDSTLPGWKVETLGDDICWIRVGADGYFYASNPETGFFGVAPGTSDKTNRNAMQTMRANSIFTNAALTEDGRVWWKGMTDIPPQGLTDWRGRPWDADSGPAMHPNARFTAPIEQCPSLAEEWCRPEGVRLSAILVGGRRASAVPLVTEAFSWEHGVYMGATLASESTAASEHDLGSLRRDPFAMNPFCGYNMGDYFAHWLSFAQNEQVDKAHMPRFFMVNWFRTDENGRFIWPGFGDNIRVLKWIVERLEGTAEAVATPVGNVPAEGSLDLDGLAIHEDDLAPLMTIDREAWRKEAEANRDYLAGLGARVPERLHEEQDALENRLSP